MICKIDGETVSPAAVTYRELGFGQAVDAPVHEYQIEFAKEELAKLLEEKYGHWLADQKADDAGTGVPSPPYFKDLGYPSLAKLMQHPDHFEDAMRELLLFDWLEVSFPAVDEKALQWVINSADEVKVNNGRVLIRGKAFERQAG